MGGCEGGREGGWEEGRVERIRMTDGADRSQSEKDKEPERERQGVFRTFKAGQGRTGPEGVVETGKVKRRYTADGTPSRLAVSTPVSCATGGVCPCRFVASKRDHRLHSRVIGEHSDV